MSILAKTQNQIYCHTSHNHDKNIGIIKIAYLTQIMQDRFILTGNQALIPLLGLPGSNQGRSGSKLKFNLTGNPFQDRVPTRMNRCQGGSRVYLLENPALSK